MLGDFITPDPQPATPSRKPFAGLGRGKCFTLPEFRSLTIRKRGQFEWTAEAIEKVLELWNAGKSKSEIADYFNVTMHCITGSIYRHRSLFAKRPSGFGNPNVVHWKRGQRTADLMNASQLWATGASVRQIARELGLKRNQVAGIAYRNRDLFPERQSPIKRGAPIE